MKPIYFVITLAIFVAAPIVAYALFPEATDLWMSMLIPLIVFVPLMIIDQFQRNTIPEHMATKILNERIAQNRHGREMERAKLNNEISKNSGLKPKQPCEEKTNE